MKNKKVSATPKPNNPFVLTISNIIGFDEESCCIRLKTGYAAVIKVPGIDIVNYKPSDQEFSYQSFAIALQQVPVAHKIIIMSDKADYSEQIHFLQSRLNKTEKPFSRYLLERHIGWLRSYEMSQDDRSSYILFFAQDAVDAADAADHYVAHLRIGKNAAVRCNQEQCVRLLKVLNHGGDGV